MVQRAADKRSGTRTDPSAERRVEGGEVRGAGGDALRWTDTNAATRLAVRQYEMAAMTRPQEVVGTGKKPGSHETFTRSPLLC